jgi:hypothetical protein
MTGPGKISIGNVGFNSKDVKSYTVEMKGDEKINSVMLKNGTKLTFKDQDAKGLQSVRGLSDNLYSFLGIKGLTIEGSENNDHYSLINCDGYNVDTRGGGKDRISLKDSIRGEVRADENDIIENSSRNRNGLEGSIEDWQTK